MPTDAIECPLCLGEGKLKRTEVLDRLGVKDFARVAQLSAEEAFRLLLQKHRQDEQNVWARFETELTKRTAEIERRHGDQLQPLVVRIKELESAANVSIEQKTLEIQRVRAELEDKLRSEQSQTGGPEPQGGGLFQGNHPASGAESRVGNRDGKGCPGWEAGRSQFRR